MKTLSDKRTPMISEECVEGAYWERDVKDAVQELLRQMQKHYGIEDGWKKEINEIFGDKLIYPSFKPEKKIDKLSKEVLEE